MVKVNIINAFTDSGEGGNPAGVVFPADSLSNELKQKVAAKVGVSETAFVSASKVADFKLDFFTPTKQIPHCGHATIATYSYLSQQGLIRNPESSKETIDGNRRIFIRGDIAYMEQLDPKYVSLDEEAKVDVLASLGVNDSALMIDQEPTITYTGNSFMIIPIKDEGTLKNLRPDLKAIELISKKFNLIGFYPFTLQTQVAGRDAAARMFAPYYGIQEESGTGMAAGPLACFLYDKLNIKKEKFTLEQGRLMPKPSPSEILVELTLEEGRIARLIAGGRAKVMRSFDVKVE